MCSKAFYDENLEIQWPITSTCAATHCHKFCQQSNMSLQIPNAQIILWSDASPYWPCHLPIWKQEKSNGHPLLPTIPCVTLDSSRSNNSMVTCITLLALSSANLKTGEIQRSSTIAHAPMIHLGSSLATTC